MVIEKNVKKEPSLISLISLFFKLELVAVYRVGSRREGTVIPGDIWYDTTKSTIRYNYHSNKIPYYPSMMIVTHCTVFLTTTIIDWNTKLRVKLINKT